MSITRPLTKEPKFLLGLDTEHVLKMTEHDEDTNIDEKDESERVITGFEFFGSNGDIVTGAVNTAAKAAVGVNLIIGSITDKNPIIKAAQGAEIAQVLIPERPAMLGMNSSQFYSIVGGAVGVTAQPVQQTVDQTVKANKEFPILWFINFSKHMESQDVGMVHLFWQKMTYFRSWSSQKWWEEVARCDGGTCDDESHIRLLYVFRVFIRKL